MLWVVCKLRCVCSGGKWDCVYIQCIAYVVLGRHRFGNVLTKKHLVSSTFQHTLYVYDKCRKKLSFFSGSRRTTFCNYFQSAFRLTKRQATTKKRTITIFRGYNIATTFRLLKQKIISGPRCQRALPSLSTFLAGGHITRV